MRKNIYILYAIGLLQGMVFYGPIATLYRQAQGVTVFQITLIESISLALCIALEVPWGVVADRIGYRKTMIFCCLLYFVSKILFWQATDFWWFLAERILLSVVIAGMSGVDSSILYLSCQGRSSQKVFGIYSGMGMAGLLIAAGVFSLVVRDNYPLAACLTVISYALAAVLALGLTEVKQETSPQHHGQLRKALPKGSLVLFLLAAAFLAETHQTITVFLNQLQYQRCGLGEGAMGWAYILATVLGLAEFSLPVSQNAPESLEAACSLRDCPSGPAWCWHGPGAEPLLWEVFCCCGCPTPCFSPSRPKCRTGRFRQKTGQRP